MPRSVVLAGASIYAWYWFEIGRVLESTDDAHVKAHYTTIAPKVSGYIAEVVVEDNSRLRRARCWRGSTIATTALSWPRPRQSDHRHQPRGAEPGVRDEL
jgi:hypothetical protein